MAIVTYQQIELLGNEIDSATDAHDAAKLHALDLQGAEYCGAENSDYRAYLWYFRSNIQAALQDISDPRSWEWRQTYRERQILYLRRAASDPTFVRLAPLSQASILTNMANSLSSLGRGLESIPIYDAALEIVPRFAMALGNKGSALQTIVPYVPDPGHAMLMLAYAHASCKAAISESAAWEGGHPSFRERFADIAVDIEKRIDPDALMSSISLDDFPLGRSRTEKSYRLWALHNNLFLNPLNAIGPHAIAATDRMNLPAYVSPVGDPPIFIAWFNQMKQEYVAARWFLFEGARRRQKHLADREVFLVNTLDYPAFGIHVEKLRASFRLAFSLMDKVAGFINAYFRLGMDQSRVDIRSIWHTKKGELRPEFRNKPNLALRGLYWLALDIIGDAATDKDSIAPEAAELKRLRNVLEHRCLILRDMEVANSMDSVETVSLEDFEEFAMQILGLARAALMYLAFSLRKEEADRRPEGNDRIPGAELPIF